MNGRIAWRADERDIRQCESVEATGDECIVVVVLKQKSCLVGYAECSGCGGR